MLFSARSEGCPLKAVDAVAVGADVCHLEALLGAVRRDQSPWLRAHGRIYVRRDILDTFKRYKLSVSSPPILLSCSIYCRLRCKGNKGEKRRAVHLYFSFVLAAT